MRLIDHAANRAGAGACKTAGYDGAIRYLCDSPDRGLPNKSLTPDEAKGYLDRGMPIVSNWQKGKNATADWRRGFQGGVDDAHAALSHHFYCGGPGYRPIYFSVDEDVNLDTWNSLVLPYLNGAASVLGREWVGVYGGQRSMWWADDDGFRWRWQTKGWSRYDANGNWNASLPVQWVDGVQIRQERVDQDSINGIGIDVNTTWADDFGQWQAASAPAQQSVPEVLIKEIDQTGVSPNHSNRNGARIRLFVLHTQEGNGTAQSLANYLQNSASEVSYHYSIDNDTCIDVVDTDRASWSVLDANPYTVNLCFAGSRASQSRDVWLNQFGRAIDYAAFLFVQDARKYGTVDARVIGWDEIRAGKSGGTDHMGITKGLGIGTHTDCGPNFPWDVYASAVSKYATGANPVVNEIDEKAKTSPWLGARKTNGENATPDGRGRWVEFENAFVYWTAETGAHPIPMSLFGKFADLGWEGGQLGYPVTDHTVLNGPDGKPWGDVQGFQGGALYRRYDRPAFWVHGEIRNRWNRSGFENGLLGWPTSDEIPFDTGAYQEFERGRVYFTPKPTLATVAENGIDTPLSDPKG